MKIVLIAVPVVLVVAVAAGALPDAGEVDVLRAGLFGSAAIQYYSYILYGLPSNEYYDVRAPGAGGGAWGQYDLTWFAYATRLEVTAFKGNDFNMTFTEWDHNHYVYLMKGAIRPFVVPSYSIGYAGRFRGYVGIGGGIRWNIKDSPSYVTVNYGVKHVWGDDYEKGKWGAGKLSWYFPLTDSLALYAGAELEEGGRDYRYKGNEADGLRWRGRLDVGPSWAF